MRIGLQHEKRCRLAVKHDLLGIEPLPGSRVSVSSPELRGKADRRWSPIILGGTFFRRTTDESTDTG